MFALSVFFLSHSNAAPSSAVFYYAADGSGPVLRLDRVPNMSEGMKAILALYALENGADCRGPSEQGGLKCALTAELGLGANCSQEHLALVRKWFPVVPELTGRWSRKWNEDSSKEGSLERLCYTQTDSGSWQNIWQVIRVTARGNKISVTAIMQGGSQYGQSRIKYVNEYKITERHVKVTSSRKVILERSQRPLFG